MADLDKAISLSPHNPYVYYDRGNLHAVSKDYVKAVADYTKAIELDPNLLRHIITGALQTLT